MSLLGNSPASNHFNNSQGLILVSRQDLGYVTCSGLALHAGHSGPIASGLVLGAPFTSRLANESARSNMKFQGCIFPVFIREAVCLHVFKKLQTKSYNVQFVSLIIFFLFNYIYVQKPYHNFEMIMPKHTLNYFFTVYLLSAKTEDDIDLGHCFPFFIIVREKYKIKWNK